MNEGQKKFTFFYFNVRQEVADFVPDLEHIVMFTYNNINT